ncbi:hypothetical protein ACQPZ2_36800 [Nocardia pseudovaccinii]|uniref:hypothetical protein n=1 Tax=Nocardia pseudovaccinii TaxID=189540 RepID=UPI003D941CE6
MTADPVTVGGVRKRRGQEAFLAWQSAFFDPDRWYPQVVARRVAAWIEASRWRRRIVVGVVTFTVLVVVPVAVGALATAQPGAVAPTEHGTASSAPNSGLSWTHVRDSSGVELSKYTFVTDHGGPFHPGTTALAVILDLEFAGWNVIVTFAIWLVGWALSFSWLNVFSSALHGVAVNLTGQIATPLMLVTAATIGAFFVAYFVTRGFYSKATMQVVSMLGVAIAGTLFLSDPLAEVLSSDGWLAQGRNVGISVAAGLNGDADPNPAALVATIQSEMADNFARKPLQVWNFGHVVDDRPACKATWTAAVNSGNDERVKNGMKSCGDSAAYAAADDPTARQVGAGLVLLLAGAVLLLFAVYLGLKIIKAALDAIYHGFMSIFGFAAGGFIYGPTQTFLVRNMVDSFIAAGRMAAYTIFLGVYLLFLGDLFRQARGQEMAVFVIGAVVEIIAIFQLRKLGSGLSSGNDWVANRFALAMQRGSSAGGAGGGRALGMGQFGASHASTTALVSGLGTVAEPAMEWFVGRGHTYPHSRIDGNMGPAHFRQIARRYGQAYGGVGTARGAAAAVEAVVWRAGGGLAEAAGALELEGWSGPMISDAMEVYAEQQRYAQHNPLVHRPLAELTAAQTLAENSLGRLAGLGGRQARLREEQRLQAAVYAMERATLRYRDSLPRGVDLIDGVNTLNGHTYRGNHLRSIVNDYLANPTEAKMRALEQASRGDTSAMGRANAFGHLGLGARDLESVARDPAARMMQSIANADARNLADSVHAVVHSDLRDLDLHREVRHFVGRAVDTDNWSTGTARSASAPSPPNRP